MKEEALKLEELVERCKTAGMDRFVVIGLREKGNGMVDLLVYDDLGSAEAVIAALETALDAVVSATSPPDKDGPVFH